MGKTAKMTIPPAAGMAGYKLWQSYKSGSLDFLHGKGDDGLTADAGGVPLGAAQAKTVHGQEEENVQFDPEVYQFYPDTCAIQSQHLVLEQYGIDVTQNEMIEVAKANGWYAEGYGTPKEYVGKLLEYYGVDINSTEGNNVFNLASELSQGHQVIVAVDAGELVTPDEEIIEDNTADHALVVVGIDTSDTGDVKVIVTDPGTGNRQWAYSQDQFIDAWKDSNCFMVSTEQSPEEFSGGQFQELDEFAGIPTDTINQMAEVDLSASYDFMDAIIDSMQTNPEGWANVVEDYPNIFQYDDSGTLHIYDPASGDDLTIADDIGM